MAISKTLWNDFGTNGSQNWGATKNRLAPPPFYCMAFVIFGKSNDLLTLPVISLDPLVNAAMPQHKQCWKRKRCFSRYEAYIGSGDVLIPLHHAPNWHLPIASNCLKEGGIEAVQDYLKNTGSNAQASEGRISSFVEEMFDPEIRVCLNIPQYITYILGIPRILQLSKLSMCATQRQGL